MRRSLVILAAIIALAAAVIAIPPAALLGVVLERESNGTLTLADADGTLWRGRGTLTARAFRLPLAWSIDPWPLVRGELRLHVVPPTATADAPRAEITARRDALTLRELNVALPAESFESFAPRVDVRVAGDVRVAASLLEWTPATFGGGARIEWNEARFGISIEPAIALGAVSAALTADGDRLAGPVTNAGGDFDLRGTLSLHVNGTPQVSLTMTPRSGDPAQARTLSIAGTPGGGGLNVEYRAGTR